MFIRTYTSYRYAITNPHYFSSLLQSTPGLRSLSGSLSALTALSSLNPQLSQLSSLTTLVPVLTPFPVPTLPTLPDKRSFAPTSLSPPAAAAVESLSPTVPECERTATSIEYLRLKAKEHNLQLSSVQTWERLWCKMKICSLLFRSDFLIFDRVHPFLTKLRFGWKDSY